MPIYEFECPKCHDRLEVLVIKSNDPRRAFCVMCHVEMEQALTTAAFHLKGRGWAKDGYENPLKGDDLQNVTGEDFRKEYRKQLADPDHPRQVGDILKGMGRKGDDLSDL